MRRARFRPPVVVTLAVAAASAACSNGTSTVNPPATDSGAGTDSSSPDTRVDVTTEVIDETPKPQPKSCPADDPGYGAINKSCDAPAADRCSYPDRCPAHPATSDKNVYACKDNGSGTRTWTLVSDDYLAPCPMSIPTDGDPCLCAIHLGPEACAFGTCETMRALAVCHSIDSVGTTWTVVPIGCNPPEPDGGKDGGDASGDASEAGGG